MYNIHSEFKWSLYTVSVPCCINDTGFICSIYVFLKIRNFVLYEVFITSTTGTGITST